MNVYYRRYRLTPKKRVNRLSSLEEKTGVHLMVRKSGAQNYADYFPHQELGDRSTEQFLEEFRFQRHEYDQKVLHFLRHDDVLRAQEHRAISNHQLWDGIEEIKAPVIKYKLRHREDTIFTSAIARGRRVRLDGNGLFEGRELANLLGGLPKEVLAGIEYIEDPMRSTDWTESPVPTAMDFIAGSPHDFYIYKPNCESYPLEEKKVIFSSYLGSCLGKWQAYCELLEKGDLQKHHGIVSEGYYQEERLLFTGNYLEGFRPDPTEVKALYDDLHAGQWKLLCSI